MIDHGSIVPLYEQLAAIIGNEIVDGKYLPGERISGEQALADKYGLSRVTVRHALALLTERGFVVSRQGKGTFVSDTAALADDRLKKASFSFSRLRDRKIPDTEILFSGIRQCGPELASLTGRSEKEMMGVVRRLRFADKVPAVLEYDYFPSAISGVATDNLANISLIALLDEKYGLKAVLFENSFRIVRADEDLAKLMQVEPDTPLLGVFETVMGADRSVIYYDDQIIRTDTYEYRLRYRFE